MLWTQICVSFWIFSCGVRGDTDTEEEKNYILCQNFLIIIHFLLRPDWGHFEVDFAI